MDKDEALRIALEALVDFGWHIENCPQFPTWAEPKKHPPCTCGYDTAITALRQALDHVPDTTKMIEPDMGIDRGAWDDVPDATKWVDELRGGDETEQDPVAWMYVNRDGECEQIEFGTAFDDPSVTLLYTAPPKREWVGLTDDEIGEVGIGNVEGEHMLPYSFARAIEAKLKEKNT